MFIEATHVQYLEAAGARVVPIDYRVTEEELKRLLENLNGVYIPGDQRILVSNPRELELPFTKAVQRILHWAQEHNEKEDKHFPVMGVAYGCLAMLRSQMRDDKYLQDITPSGDLQINLAHKPQHTYIFDEFETEKLENILDNISFLSSLSLGISLNDFVKQE